MVFATAPNAVFTDSSGGDNLFAESDHLAFRYIGNTPWFSTPNRGDEIRIDIDVGSNSVKLALHEATLQGLVDITKETLSAMHRQGTTGIIHPGVLCGLGRDVQPNDTEHVRLNDEAIARVLNQVLPDFMKVVDYLKRQGRTIRLGVLATAAVRNSLRNPRPEGRAKTIEFLTKVEAITGAPVTVASEKLEIALSVDAVLLIGADAKTRLRAPTEGVIYYGGGNTIQVAEIKNGSVVDGHTGILQIGSRSLAGKGQVDEEIDKAVQQGAPWLDNTAAEATDAIFGGGMFRVTGRGLAMLMRDVNPATEHMPPEGYSFSIETKKELRTVYTQLRNMQKMTADELFSRAMGVSRQEFDAKIAAAERHISQLRQIRDGLADIDADRGHALLKNLRVDRKHFVKEIDEMIAKIQETDLIKIGKVDVSYKMARKIVRNWGSKIGKRYPDLATDAQFVLYRLTRMYGVDGEKLKRGARPTITFSDGNTRLAMGAFVPK